MKKVLFIPLHFFRSTYESFARGEPETYAFQRKIVAFPGSLVGTVGIAEVCVVSFTESDAYDMVLEPGLRTLGIAYLRDDGRRKSLDKVLAFIDAYKPTHAIIQCPESDLLRHCIRRRIRMITAFADSFSGKSLIGRLRLRGFGELLNNTYIEMVSNHNLPASRVLQGLGVHPDKIVPWDWPWDPAACDYSFKQGGRPAGPWKFFFAGRVTREKGVGDLIDAVRLLRDKGCSLSVAFAGAGDIECFQQQVRRFQLTDAVQFLGTIGHDEVLRRMRDADAVVVPSRVTASEGIPCVIYESYLVRTPLVVSDHPMFRAVVRDRVNGMLFQAGNAASLAKKLAELMKDAQVYSTLSAQSDKALRALIAPVTWFELIRRWLSDDPADKAWLQAHTLSAVNNG